MYKYSEYMEKNFFVPLHEYIWDKYVRDSNIDGQTAFYYAMEYISQHFVLSARVAFNMASDIMQEVWDLYYTRMEEDLHTRIEKVAPTDPNNYGVWIDDDLPW